MRLRALELAKAERFDLILSDVVMPARDGIALLEDFKAIGLASPVVMMSGQASIEMAVKATRLGASDFLEKPISSEKLLLTVENALRVRHLEEENRDLKRRLDVDLQGRDHGARPDGAGQKDGRRRCRPAAARRGVSRRMGIKA